ncbi:ABC transporter permease [Anoxybacterium hadale]|uniref:ABC transporter permease n=1 Tax=Anoxybacterium hadale TaxID=3408580 RepID=A0ACD1AD12_9FIRM|nr:ABC transporter permease [Clostridiales bacterium]
MKKERFELNKLTPVVSLIVMLLVFTVLTKGSMISPYNLSMLIDQSVVLIIACCGTIFVSAQGRVDLSVGVNCAFSAVIGDLAYRATGSSLIMVVTALLVGVGIGLVNGILISRYKVPSFMATLAILIGLRGIINYIQSIVSVNYASDAIMMLSENQIKLPLLILIVLIFWYLFEYTSLGRYCKAIGENEVVASSVGMPVARSKIAAYALSGLTAAISCIFLMARLGGTSTTMGTFFEMKVMTAIYVGGVLVRGGSTAKMYKAILGAFIVMIIENGLKIMGYASSEISEFVQGLLLMVILFLTVFFELRRQKVKKAAGQEA